MKQYIGISRDHSGSMYSLAGHASKDYNMTINSIKTASREHGCDTIVSVVECGGTVRRVVTNSSVDQLTELTEHKYKTNGDTPLFDSIDDLIKTIQHTPDCGEPGVTFLIIAITDGEDNASRISGQQLSTKIRALQQTDRWTFVFRVPKGYSNSLVRLGIPEGNIQEWEQTTRGLEQSSRVTQAAITNYYGNVSRGIKSSSTFFTDMKNVSTGQVEHLMDEITSEVKLIGVESRADISTFMESKTRRSYNPGTAYYQLTKTESRVQPYKVIAIRHKYSGKTYAGQAARRILNLPNDKTIRLSPKNNGDWTIFIQSTSSNRILLPGTSVLYWPQGIA